MPVAAAAGAVTFLSPCCLPLVPGYLSYLTGMSGSAASAQPAASAEPAVAISSAVAVAGTADGGSGVDAAAAPAGTLVDSASPPAAPPARSRVMLGSVLFILGFSALFSVEGVTVASLGDTLRLHAVGLAQILGSLIIVLGLLFIGLFDVFSFARRHARLVTRIGGLLLIVVGVLEVTGAWASAITWLQVHWLSSYTAPI